MSELRPNPRLQRARFPLLRSPLSRKPLGVPRSIRRVSFDESSAAAGSTTGVDLAQLAAGDGFRPCRVHRACRVIDAAYRSGV